jgi:glutamyl-tRNA synthetase
MEKGYLREAIVNYVALLGWSPRGEREIYSIQELAQAFDLAGISKSQAIFDIEKLTYFNSEYIRAMTPEAFAAVAEPYIRQAVKNPAIDPAAIAALLQQRTEVLTDIPGKLGFFDALPDYDNSLYVHKKSKSDEASSREMLTAALPVLEAIEAWDDAHIHDAMVSLAETLEVKNAKLMWPVRIAVTGTAVTPGGAVEICRILGKEETLRRIRNGLERLA